MTDQTKPLPPPIPNELPAGLYERCKSWLKAMDKPLLPLPSEKKTTMGYSQVTIDLCTPLLEAWRDSYLAYLEAAIKWEKENTYKSGTFHSMTLAEANALTGEGYRLSLEQSYVYDDGYAVIERHVFLVMSTPEETAARQEVVEALLLKVTPPSGPGDLTRLIQQLEHQRTTRNKL